MFGDVIGVIFSPLLGGGGLCPRVLGPFEVMKRVACVLGLLVCGPLHAADSAAAVEVLKERALDLAVADAARHEELCPLPGRLELYFGGLAEVRPFRLSLIIDGTLLERGFDAAEARALVQGGLFRFDCRRVSRGRHHLQATLSWIDGGSEPQPVQLEQDFELPAPGSVLELRLRSGLLGTSLKLSMRSGEAWRSVHGWRWRLGFSAPEGSGDRFIVGGSEDPRMRQAHFLLDTGHAMSATVVLRGLLAAEQDKALSPRFSLELAQAELAYGLSASAEARWRAAPELAATRGQRTALGFELAQYRYRRGELAAAQLLLGVPKAPHGLRPEPELTARQGLYSMLLLAQGRSEQAAEVLRDTFNTADYESWVHYYNFGVALINSGQVPQGVTVLNRVGSVATDSRLLRRLCDRANLALARHFLESGQGATAIPVFGRIDSTGPESASALLGLGWAWLAPPGAEQPEIALGDEIMTGAPPETLDGAAANVNDQNLYQRFHIMPFAQASLPNDDSDRLRRALAAWIVVAERDEPDTQPEEAMIDIAWALRRLGAAQQAAQYNERAVGALEHQRAVLDEAEAWARDTAGLDRWLAGDKAMEPGLPWELPTLPPLSAGVWLVDLLATDSFQAALLDYRDLLLLQGRMGDDGDAALSADLQGAQQIQRVILRDLQLEALAGQRPRVEVLLRSAREALVRVYDNPDAAAQPPR